MKGKNNRLPCFTAGLLARILHKSSTALRNAGTGAGIVRCATLQGVDPASPAHPLETPTSTRPSFARYEFYAICGLAALVNPICPIFAQEQPKDLLTEIPQDQIQQSRNRGLEIWEGDLFGQDSYKPGSYAQIEAVPNPGFEFEKWEGDSVQNPNAAKTVVIMQEHLNIKPVWKRIWNVIAQSDNKQAGKVEGGGKYPDGAEVTLSAEPNEGFKFLGWEGRGIRQEEKEDLTTTLVADGHHDVVARFENENQDQDQDQNQDQQDQNQDQQDQDESEQDQQDREQNQDPSEQDQQPPEPEPEEEDPAEPEEQDGQEEPQTEEQTEGEDAPAEEQQVPPSQPTPVQMTPEEALRLLEAMEDDEKKLPLFIVQPPDPNKDPKKDW